MTDKVRPLKTYDDWKHCITRICKVPLTSEFVAQRLEELRRPDDFYTRKFIRSWGEAHLRQVIAWFEQTEAELAGGRAAT